MIEMIRGFRGKIPSGQIVIDMNISGGSVYDFSCFGVDENDKLSDDRYMIFYNQPESPDGEITYAPYHNGARFTLNLSRLPAKIAKLVFTVSIDGNGSMSQISAHTLTLTPENNEAMTMELAGSDFHDERAIISIEIYRRDEWRIAAVASGFNGGLSELLKHYGGEEMQSLPTEPKPKPVELKKGQKVSLEKKPSSPLGEILINLNWHRGNERRRLMSVFSHKEGAIDLDLGCLYELKDGRKGSVQALGGNFGNFESFPYISLDNDDRTGDVETGENLRVNGSQIRQFKRILIYTFIYEGIANWKDADGVATVKCPGSPDIIVRLDEHNTSQIMCAVAMLENVNDETFSVEKVIQFFSSHSEMDKYYGWGIRWVPKRK